MILCELIYDRKQNDNRRKVKIRISDNDKTLERTMTVQEDWSFDAERQSIIDRALEDFKQSELDNLPNLVLSGLTPEQILSSTKYATAQEVVREGIRYGLEIDDVSSVALMQGVYTYLNQTFNDNQLAQYTGYSIDTIRQFNERMKATFTSGNVNEQILLIESLRGVAS